MKNSKYAPNIGAEQIVAGNGLILRETLGEGH